MINIQRAHLTILQIVQVETEVCNSNKAENLSP